MRMPLFCHVLVCSKEFHVLKINRHIKHNDLSIYFSPLILFLKDIEEKYLIHLKTRSFEVEFDPRLKRLNIFQRRFLVFLEFDQISYFFTFCCQLRQRFSIRAAGQHRIFSKFLFRAPIQLV